MTDLFCVEGIRRAAAACREPMPNGHDRGARAEICRWASL